MTAVRVQQDSPRRADAVSETDMLNTSHSSSNGGGGGPSPDESGGATIRLTESLLAASQRRSIFPMRYQNSDQSSMEEGAGFRPRSMALAAPTASLRATSRFDCLCSPSKRSPCPRKRTGILIPSTISSRPRPELEEWNLHHRKWNEKNLPNHSGSISFGCFLGLRTTTTSKKTLLE
jgi:hypothetical protein